MKTKLTLIILICIYFNTVNAQWINSLTVSSANPTTNDTIYVYADCSFPSGSCDEHTQFISVNGNMISASATHCLGMLTVICYDTDTFILPPLPYGNYNFIFNLNYGAYPAPCNPGINPGPTDTLSFNVTNISAIATNRKVCAHYIIFPNPVSSKLHLLCKDESLLNKNNFLLIYSLTGQLLLKYDITDAEMSIDVSQLSNGTYLCRIAGESVNEKHWIEIAD